MSTRLSSLLSPTHSFCFTYNLVIYQIFFHCWHFRHFLTCQQQISMSITISTLFIDINTMSTRLQQHLLGCFHWFRQHTNTSTGCYCLQIFQVFYWNDFLQMSANWCSFKFFSNFLSIKCQNIIDLCCFTKFFSPRFFSTITHWTKNRPEYQHCHNWINQHHVIMKPVQMKYIQRNHNGENTNTRFHNLKQIPNVDNSFNKIDRFSSQKIPISISKNYH